VAFLVSGGLKGLQTASIVVALPSAVIMLLMIVALVKALRNENPRLPRPVGLPRSKTADGHSRSQATGELGP